MHFSERNSQVQNKCHTYAYLYTPIFKNYYMLHVRKEHFVAYIETLLVTVLPVLIEML